MEYQEMINAVQSMMGKVSSGERRELIAKSRWTCDSHWMMAMVMNAGWDVGNKINFQVAQTVGHVEVQRLLKLLNMKKPLNIEEFRLCVTLAMETFITKDYFDYESDSTGNCAIIHRCYAYTKIHSLGLDKEYECGCFGLRAGWYQAMDVKVEEKLLKCLKNGDDRCEILIDKIVYGS